MKNLNLDPVTDLLLKTRERLTDPENWFCGNPGRSVDGKKQCLLYAISECAGYSNENLAHAVECKLLLQEAFGGLIANVPDGTTAYNCFDWSGTPDIPEWNDTHTHAEVLELLDTAIERRMKVAA